MSAENGGFAGTPGALLLRICAAPDADHGSSLAGLVASQWQEIIELAWDKRVSSLLLNAIRAAGVQDRMTGPLASELEDCARWNSLYALKQSVALCRLDDVLSGAGLSPIFLKGVRLAYSDYPEPAMRPMRDLDILLEPDDAVQAQSLLLDHPTYALAPWAGRYGIEFGHQLPELRDTEHEVTIEVHHRLNARGWDGEPVLLEKVRGEAECIAIHDRQIAVPSAHANFLHIVEHATLHHTFENGPLTLADLHYMASGGDIEWPRLIDEASSMGLLHSLHLAAAVAKNHGASWIPDMLCDGVAAARPFLELTNAALLQDRTAAMQQSFLRRLEQRSGRPPDWRGAIARIFRPNPGQLAKIAGTDSRSAWRWLGYPGWLLQRGALYFGSAGKTEIRQTSAKQLEMIDWLRQS